MNDDFARQIHEASVALLDDPGVKVEHEAILEQLVRHGARRGPVAATVRLPARMIAECLAGCPREVPLTNRRGEETRLSAGGETRFWSGPGMYLWRENVHRPFTSVDMADMARLLDHLENVHAIFGMALDDVPPVARDIIGLKVIAENSSKHIRVLCFSPEGADALVAMKAVVGAHPWFSIGFTAHGPLRWTMLALEIFKRTAGHGIPVSINGEPMAGVSGPATLAGTAAVGNAEILAGVVINQLLEPGRPCIYNLGLAHIFDMRTAIAVTGGPENALFASISAAMGRFYRLPSASWVSTEAMCPDAQAALEKMFNFHTHMASGVDCIWGVGQLESQMTVSPAQAVIDNEMIAYARRYQRGMAIDPVSLAIDLTRSVGIAGSFLEQEHTRENFRSEFYMPSLLLRIRRRQWDDSGRKRLDQRAEEIAMGWMKKSPAHALSDTQQKGLEKIASEFIRKAGGQ